MYGNLKAYIVFCVFVIYHMEDLLAGRLPDQGQWLPLELSLRRLTLGPQWEEGKQNSQESEGASENSCGPSRLGAKG